MFFFSREGGLPRRLDDPLCLILLLVLIYTLILNTGYDTSFVYLTTVSLFPTPTVDSVSVIPSGETFHWKLDSRLPTPLTYSSPSILTGFVFLVTHGSGTLSSPVTYRFLGVLRVIPTSQYPSSRTSKSSVGLLRRQSTYVRRSTWEHETET